MATNPDNTVGANSAAAAWRQKYRLAAFDKIIRNAMVAEKICQVDHSDVRRIQNPYGSQPTTVVQSLDGGNQGTYTPAAFTITDQALTVTDEFIVSEHIYDFEDVMAQFDLFANRTDEQLYSVALALDKYVLNTLLEAANTSAYTTPAGGFTTASNINVIMSNLIALVAGYADVYKGMYLVIENTDVPGFIQAQATNGFSYADAALNNGFMSSYMGVEVYVVRAGTFANETTSAVSGTQTWTNLGHRLFGIKGVTTFASPRGVRFEEKSVSGKTGKELVTYGYCGFAAWTPKIALTVDITLA